MRESQYALRYLQGNADRGPGQGVTVGTFLAQTLRGNAKKYSGDYARALEAACLRRVAQGTATVGQSVQGKVAYYPIEVAQ